MRKLNGKNKLARIIIMCIAVLSLCSLVSCTTTEFVSDPGAESISANQQSIESITRVSEFIATANLELTEQLSITIETANTIKDGIDRTIYLFGEYQKLTQLAIERLSTAEQFIARERENISNQTE